MRLHLSCLMCLSIILMNSFQVYARESVVLSGQDVSKFLADRTMTVTEVEPDQKTGEMYRFKAYFSEVGGIRAVRSDGQTFEYDWEIGDNGSLCLSNYWRYSGRLCGFVVVYKDAGFVVQKHEDEYKFYMNDRGNTSATLQNGNVVFNPGWRHYFNFSDIQQGEKL